MLGYMGDEIGLYNLPVVSPGSVATNCNWASVET